MPIQFHIITMKEKKKKQKKTSPPTDTCEKTHGGACMWGWKQGGVGWGECAGA